MKNIWITLFVLWLIAPLGALAQVWTASPKVDWEFSLDPATAGVRVDDNVYRSVTDAGRLTDGILSGDWGAQLRTRYDLFRGLLNYQLGDDQYLTYTDLNNLKNDLNLLLAVEPGDWDFYYKFDYFLRTSDYFDFNYYDTNGVVGAKWSPRGPWCYEAEFKNLSRQYFDHDPSVWSKNFIDQSGVLSVQKEIDDLFSVKLAGSYTNRQFNRYAVLVTGNSLTALQTDDTWKAVLTAHLYVFSILQEVNLTGERTNSNSYGFSNTVESFSWAGVIRPSSAFYLQLLFRLYLKTYDQTPPTNQDLQLGFIDDDGQDLLAVKANLDMGSGWVGSLSLSRIRSESDQPGAYYVKDIISTQIRKSF